VQLGAALYLTFIVRPSECRIHATQPVMAAFKLATPRQMRHPTDALDKGR
jgi:hypothetical protein